MDDIRLPYFIVLNNGIVAFAIFDWSNYDHYIGFPKLLPNRQDLKPSSLGMRPVSSYKEWFTNPPQVLLPYLKYVSAFDARLYCFPKKDIAEIIHPLNWKSEITPKNKQTKHYRQTEKIISKISSVLDIEQSDIGVEGSTLLSTSNDASDIDLLVYGKHNAARVAKNFYKLEVDKEIRLLDPTDKPTVFKKRRGLGYGHTINTIYKQEQRRFYGFINDKKFCIINVLGKNENDLIDMGRSIEYIGVFRGVIEIISNKYGIVTPSIVYGMHKGNKYRIEIIDHYGINQTQLGEKFFIKAKCFKNTKTDEKIIIYAYWNNLEQHFNLLN